LNQNVDRTDNFLVKRFYNLDDNTYLEGSTASEVQRADGIGRFDGLPALRRLHQLPCHSVLPAGRKSPRAGGSHHAALVVGGSIIIPHLRRAYELLTELYD